MPTVMFMISIDCVRSAPPRSSAFQLACRNADDSTSTMEKGVSKAGSFIVSVLGARGVKHGGRRSPLLLERGFQAVELGHQRIANRGAFGGRRMDRRIE